MKIISTNTKKDTGDTYSRGSNIPTLNKRPPMPPVKHPKENKRQEQKDTCVNCRYYSVDPLSDPCDECIGKAGFGYNRFAHKKNNIRNNYGWVGWLINMLIYVVALGVASKHNDQTGCVIFSACLIFIFGMFLEELAK